LASPTSHWRRRCHERAAAFTTEVRSGRSLRQERQIELLERVVAAGPNLVGLHGPTSMLNDASVYTDPARFDREMDVLFRGWPVLFALSCELPEPGDYRASTIAGVPVVVIRQPDRRVVALVNTCRHRGAPLVDDDLGKARSSLSCPYHAWTYDLDGTLRSRPGSAGGFDDVEANCDLIALPVAERHGLIFVRPGGGDAIDVDTHLAGAEDDLGSYGLAQYVHVETRACTWPFNWKLVLDTFGESYHVRTLHKATLAPTFDSNAEIFEPFGPHMVGIGLRKDTIDQTTQPRNEWSLLALSTVQYFLVPGALVVHQIDHIEVWRLQPIDVRTTETVVSIFAPTAPHSERSRNYFVKNLDLLLGVTGNEDFVMMAKIQQHLDGGLMPHVVYGRNEAPLVHLHQTINRTLDDAARRDDDTVTKVHCNPSTPHGPTNDVVPVRDLIFEF
jgi:phenylpropionate dioxygenase-like ring-hydroxylating dioxygenase large terminal subunit